MKAYPLFTLLLSITLSIANAQDLFIRRVVDAKLGTPIVGASITVLPSFVVSTTNAVGYFEVPVRSTDTLVISHLGYDELRILVSSVQDGQGQITLKPSAETLQEVVINTGYQHIPRERATGSFTHIDQALLNEVVATTILEKLEGNASGIQFDRRIMTPNAPIEGSTGSIRIRGVSTIESNESPLIILDNFPYEGPLDAINPNDVSSITILRDAAAASIWGARAGNGVIVITTKRGTIRNEPKLSATSNLTIGQKPDLFYNRNWLPSETVMSIEEDLFIRGRYFERDQTPLPAYVELLIKRRDGLIDATEFEAIRGDYRQTDLRKEAARHLYRTSTDQQHAINISGGGAVHAYYLSGGYDRSVRATIGDNESRLSLLAKNTFSPHKRLEVHTGIRYVSQSDERNGISLSSLNHASPYSKLMDEKGNPLAVIDRYRYTYQEQAINEELLDWLYRPLDERGLRSQLFTRNDIQLDGVINYQPANNLNVQVSYQYMQGRDEFERFFDKTSYYVRSLVNQFTQPDGEKIIPEGGIREKYTERRTHVHSGRIKVDFERDFAERWNITALTGSEIRQQQSTTLPGFILYGFNENVYTGINNINYAERFPTRPIGTTTLPMPLNTVALQTTRFLSYFANAALSFDNRYILSGSVRWDGSNLFGVKANHKGVPLWSLGGSWVIDDGYRLRVTYGRSGNVNHQVSVYPIISYGTSLFTNQPFAYLTSAGNPNLQWEQVTTTNFGFDFSMFNGRVDGNFEYFNKFASNLIGEDVLDPTSGIVSTISPVVRNQVNYASLRTHGVDIQVNTRNLVGRLKWATTWLLSYTRNQVKRFNTSQLLNAQSVLSLQRAPVPGESLDALFALPWSGLDPATGRTLIFDDNGTQIDDYYGWLRDYPVEKLINVGVTAAPYFGSIRNTWAYADFQLSATVTWKAGHIFRRTSMLPASLNRAGAVAPNYHMDYLNRWQQPGDELHTSVPSTLSPGASVLANFEDDVYRYSEALITNASHVRLQDVRMAYRYKSNIEAYLYLRNLGLLWNANQQGIDPDYAISNFPPPRTIALGIQITL